jgi:transposase-like protein
VVAREQDIHPGVLSKWVKREKSKRVLECKDPQEEITQLKEEIRDLRTRTESLRCMLEKAFLQKYSGKNID